jgi:hypothetical protein
VFWFRLITYVSEKPQSTSDQAVAMVVVFKYRLLHALGVDDGDVECRAVNAYLPGDAHLHPSGLSMFDDGLVSSDKWTTFASSLLISSVSNLMACLRLVGARQGMITFI